MGHLRVHAILILGLVGLVIGGARPSHAAVLIEKILESGPTSPLAFSISRVRVDAGLVAIEYLEAGTRNTVIGLFGQAGADPHMLDSTTDVPGFASPCFGLVLGGLSAGRVFFECSSETEPDVHGTYVLADDVWTPLVTQGGGVPTCSGDLASLTFSRDDNDAVDFGGGRLLVRAWALDGPSQGCHAYVLAEPSGVTPVGHVGLPFPSEFGPSHSAGRSAAIGEAGFAFQWEFNGGEIEGVEYGIFVDRGQGLETWAGTVPSTPQFDEPQSSFGERMRWNRDGLVFEFHRGGSLWTAIYVANGSSIVSIVTSDMIAPDTGMPFEHIYDLWDAAGDVVVFEASAGGVGDGLYLWEAGEISLLAREGMPLPGGSEPIVAHATIQFGGVQVSDELVFFMAAFGDGSVRLYARDPVGLIEVARTVATPPSLYAPWFDLTRRGADGRQILYELPDGPSTTTLYRATVGQRDVPVLSPLALEALVVWLAVVGGGLAWRLRRGRVGRAGRGGTASENAEPTRIG